MGERAFIVHPVLASVRPPEKHARSAANQLEEICALAQAIHLGLVHAESVNVSAPNPALLLGKGTVARLAEACAELEPDVVIVNHTLSPVQQRNLEKELKAKVIDRTGLILEIFGERAQTKEGRIQVELAALEYQKSRLVRSWTHLERQRGKTGFIGGPGETQIELDRRLISDQVTRLKKELEHVRKTRDLGRKARERVPFPIIALVGYTNAGKSTLFNTLTEAKVMAEDLLFATLDPTMRKLELPSGQIVILADTVGFISDLPTSLIAAFRSTLEQVHYADIILHVRDISRADTEAQKQDVIDVLHDLDIHYEGDPRIMEIWNKIDAVEEGDKAMILNKAGRSEIPALPVSALSGEGLNILKDALAAKLAESRVICAFALSHSDGEALSWLYEHGEVLEREDRVGDIAVSVRLSTKDRDRFEPLFGIHPAPAEQEDHVRKTH